MILLVNLDPRLRGDDEVTQGECFQVSPWIPVRGRLLGPGFA